MFLSGARGVRAHAVWPRSPSRPEFGRQGITVNAIAPGLVQTLALRERVQPRRWAETAGRQAVPRTLEPADLLAALDFLVSDAASAVAGTTVPVNGGRVWL